MAKILVIDDERAIRNTMKEILEFEGHIVETAEDGKAGLEKALNGEYQLIFSDVKMPEMDGLEFLAAYHSGMQQAGNEYVPVVMISGHGTVESAVESLKSGAFDFIVKPLDLNRLLLTTKHALEHKSLVQETKILRKKVGAKNQMIGESPAITRVREIINKVAPTEARVLPPAAEQLLNVVRLRWLCCSMGIEKVILKQGHLTLFFCPQQRGVLAVGYFRQGVAVCLLASAALPFAGGA